MIKRKNALVSASVQCSFQIVCFDGKQGVLYKWGSLPGSYPQIAGAAPLREHLDAAVGRCFR